MTAPTASVRILTAERRVAQKNAQSHGEDR